MRNKIFIIQEGKKNHYPGLTMIEVGWGRESRSVEMYSSPSLPMRSVTTYSREKSTKCSPTHFRSRSRSNALGNSLLQRRSQSNIKAEHSLSEVLETTNQLLVLGNRNISKNFEGSKFPKIAHLESKLPKRTSPSSKPTSQKSKHRLCYSLFIRHRGS